MAISIKRYVNIQGAVEGAAVATGRSFCMLMLTDNTSFKPASDGSLTEITSIDQFPLPEASQEYQMAELYFSIQNNGLQPQKLYLAAYQAGSAQTALQAAIEQTNDFGSFVFSPALSNTEAVEVIKYNATVENGFLYSLPIAQISDAQTGGTLNPMIGIEGTAAIYSPSPTTNGYQEVVIPAMLAATDFTATNGVTVYMYKQVQGITPTVTDDATADTLDTLRINYYGETKTAGTKIDFLQRGVMWGDPETPTDVGVYCNEMWLRDACSDAIINALVSLREIPATTQGAAQIRLILLDVITQAKSNGTIQAGKTLTMDQQLTIANLTGDPTAAPQINTLGYWLSVKIIQKQGLGGETEYGASYQILYAKNDAIRFVNGFNGLI